MELGAEFVHGKPPETLAIAVGGLDAQVQLARPVEDTIFFASEATNEAGHHGTVHGALASGLRAAKEILDRGTMPQLKKGT